MREPTDADQIRSRHGHRQGAVEKDDLSTPTAGKPSRKLIIDDHTAAEVFDGVARSVEGVAAEDFLETSLLATESKLEKQGENHQRNDDPSGHQQSKSSAECCELLSADHRWSGQDESDEGPDHGERNPNHPRRRSRRVHHGGHQPIAAPFHPSQRPSVSHPDTGPNGPRVVGLTRRRGVEIPDLRVERGGDRSRSRENRIPDRSLPGFFEGLAARPVLEPVPWLGCDIELDLNSIGAIERPGSYESLPIPCR